MFQGEKYLLLQSPTEHDIPKGHHIHQWDVLMHNVSTFFAIHHLIFKVTIFLKQRLQAQGKAPKTCLTYSVWVRQNPFAQKKFKVFKER